MRVAIDLSIARINQAGTAVYATRLLEALHKLHSGDVFEVFAVNQHRDMGAPRKLRTRLDTLYRDIIWTHGMLPWRVSRANVDLLHMPANVAPMRAPVPTVVTVHDTTVLSMPERFTTWHRHYSRLVMPLSVRSAARVITNSEATKRDVVRVFGVSEDKVTVTHLGVAEAFRRFSTCEIEDARARLGLDDFVLSVCTLEPRKNIVGLLSAYALLRERGARIPLVHAGALGWMYGEVMETCRKLGIGDYVRFLGPVSLDDLVALYNLASLFVYPSFYEGFGLPVLEAMSCGCPVITSGTSSLPEVAGEAAILVDPHDVNQLANAMQEALEDSALAQDMRERGLKRARLFTWERCAQETMAAYERVVVG